MTSQAPEARKVIVRDVDRRPGTLDVAWAEGALRRAHECYAVRRLDGRRSANWWRWLCAVAALLGVCVAVITLSVPSGFLPSNTQPAPAHAPGHHSTTANGTTGSPQPCASAQQPSTPWLAPILVPMRPCSGLPALSSARQP